MDPFARHMCSEHFHRRDCECQTQLALWPERVRVYRPLLASIAHQAEKWTVAEVQAWGFWVCLPLCEYEQKQRWNQLTNLKETLRLSSVYCSGLASIILGCTHGRYPGNCLAFNISQQGSNNTNKHQLALLFNKFTVQSTQTVSAVRCGQGLVEGLRLHYFTCKTILFI